MKKFIIGCVVLLSLLTSCAPRKVTIYCQPQHAGIYVDGVFQGNGIVDYYLPKGQKSFVVSCSEDGVTFVNRKLYTRSLPTSVSLYLDEYRTYSSGNKTLSPR